MPSKSKAQQKFMGMVHALQKGDMDPKDASPEVKKVAQSMTKKDAKDFASTSHKGLPRKVKQEILNRLKEYANKMGTDHLGGDDYTSSKKGGLRDFDGYDNVDYNKDMPMDETISPQVLKVLNLGLKKINRKFKGASLDGKTIDIELHPGHNRDSEIYQIYDLLKKLKLDKHKTSIFNESVNEGKMPNNWMSGRTSDYHTALRGKNRDYSGGTNFKKKDHGQPDIENEDDDQETNQLSNKQTHIKSDKLKVSEEMGNLSSSERIELYKLYSKAMKAMPGSPNQKKIKVLINKLRKKADLKPLPEYGQRLDLSFIEDEEARLDGTPEPKDAIDRDLDEGIMIRRAVDIAQEILPKNTWSKFASDGKKNKEYVKSIIKDLAQLLNRFYKSHDVDMRLKEEVLNEVGLWRIDHYTNSKKGLVPGRFATVKNEKDKEKKRALEKDLAQTLNGFWKRWSIPFRIDLSKTQR